MTVTIAEATHTQSASIHRLPRRIPRPASEPPYDDERPSAPHRPTRTQGALALDLYRDVAAADMLRAPRHLSIVEPGLDADDDDLFFARQPTSRASLPDPKPFCGRYVQALVEVLAGERPVNQLMRWTNDDIYAQLRHRVDLVSRATSRVIRGQRRIPSATRAVVRSVHVQEPRDGIAEAAVHVKHAGQSRAVALRLEGLDGHWRCTALQFG